MPKTKDGEFFEICGNKIPRGSRKRMELAVAQLHDYTDMKIPIEVVRGKEEGPVLLLCSAMHGDELNGCEIIKRLLAHHKILSNIKGTIVAVPIVNVFGFNRNVRYLPDRRDLNRCFPGSKIGSLGAQIAHTFLTEIVEKCTHGIDFHTGAIHRTNYPQVRATLSSKGVKDLAMAFNVPVILDASLRDGSLRQTLNQLGIPMIVYEGGEALRYEEPIIKAGLNGIFSTMVAIGMLPEKSVKIRNLKKDPFIAHSSHWLRAPRAGSLRMNKQLGDHVRAGDLMGVISNPYGRQREVVRAQHDGVIIGLTKLPLVNNGDALIHVATFANPLAVRQEIELLDDDIDIYTFSV